MSWCHKGGSISALLLSGLRSKWICGREVGHFTHAHGRECSLWGSSYEYLRVSRILANYHRPLLRKESHQMLMKNLGKK